MSDEMDVADVLDAAADYLRVHGWLQGRMGAHGGPRCGAGAVFSATCETADALYEDDVYRLRQYTLDEFSRVTGQHLMGFNDNDSRRRKDEVVDALMEAAARLRCGQ